MTINAAVCEFIEEHSEITRPYALDEHGLRRIEEICAAAEQGGDLAIWALLDALRTFEGPDVRRAARSYLTDRIRNVGARKRANLHVIELVEISDF